MRASIVLSIVALRIFNSRHLSTGKYSVTDSLPPRPSGLVGSCAMAPVKFLRIERKTFSAIACTSAEEAFPKSVKDAFRK